MDDNLLETLQRKIRELSDSLENLTFSFWKKTGSDSNSIQGSKMQSVNFVSGSTGWELSPDGDLEANNGNFRGDITGASGTFSGTLTGGSLNIPDETTADSMHVESDGDTWWGTNVATGHATAPAKILKDGAATFSSVTITGGSISGTPISSIPNDTSTDISLLDYTHTLVFSASDNDTVAWASGTITMSNGRTFAIDAGNTGNMAALTWVYLDTGVSSTVLQTTTTAATAMGANKVVIAIAQNNADASANATYVVHKGTTGIAVTASSVKTATLSAITADLGSMTAGTVTGATLRTSASNPKFQMTSTTLQGFNSSGDVIFEVVIDGANAGDVIMGDDATGSYAHYDASAPSFNVFADNVPVNTTGTFGGDGSDGALAISSGTTTVSAASAALLVKNYSSISITSTGELDFSNPHSGGTLVILKSQGAVALTSSGPSIDLRGMGATIATEPNGLVQNTNSPKGNSTTDPDVLTTGGSQYDIPAFYTTSEALLTRRYVAVTPGPGGGTGAGGSEGTGGRGGGALVIECAGALNFTGTINSSGTAGTNASGAGGGGGGGGAAGMVVILYNSLTASSGTITASGGAGGNANTPDGDTGGGAGAGSVAGAGGDGGASGGSGPSSGGTGAGGGGGAGTTTGGTAGSSMGGLVAKNNYFA